MAHPDEILEPFRQPPHSNEAEQSVLGALLLDNEAYDKVSWLRSDAFYADAHRRLWSGMVRLLEAGKPADITTLGEGLGADLGKVGGLAYIGALAQNVPSALNIKSYANLVQDRYLRRRLTQVSMEIAEEAMGPVVRDVGQVMDEAESKIFRIAESTARQGNGPTGIKPLLARVFEKIDHLYHSDNPSGVTGVPSGYIDLDAKTSGFQAGDLIIIAGRPSMGKTALALNIAEHVAVDNGLPVAIFSMEMSGTQLATRLLSSIGHVDAQKMRTGRLSDKEWGDLSDAMTKLHEQPIDIDDSGGLTALELRARARRIKRQHGRLGLVVVDYLQLMESAAKGENRATEVSEISRSLKAMAKELDCPVIALSQLNRAVDARPDKRPVMSDLRESGAIEQDADVILFLYRQVVYTPDMPEEGAGVAEVIIGKQRNGPIGMVPLTFLGQYTRFENYLSLDGTGYHRYHTPRAAPKRSVVSVDFKTKAAGE